MTNSKKMYFFVLGMEFIFCFTGCGKKNQNAKLAQTYYKLSRLEISEKDNLQSFKNALDYVDKAIKHNKKAEYLAFKATLLFRLNQFELGEAVFQDALNSDPNPKIRTEILNNKACLLAQIGMKKNQEGKINESIKIWNELENDKDYLTPEVALFNSAKVYIWQKDIFQAKDTLIKAINFAPNYIDARYYLAVLSYEIKDFACAKNELDTILFLEPDHIGAKELRDVLQK